MAISMNAASIGQRLPPSVQRILQLAHEDFRMRQSAFQSLSKNGIEAWDWLERARRSSDSEIAAQCRRLLGSIDFSGQLSRHVGSFIQYCEQNPTNRERMIIRLGQIAGDAEQNVLALLTRFESDTALAELAAVELITCGREPIDEIEVRIAFSASRASRWLRIHASSSRQRSQFEQLWQAEMRSLVAAEQRSLPSPTTSRLMRWYAERLIVLDQRQELDWIVRQIVGQAELPNEQVIETFDWLLLNQQVRGCQQLLQLRQGLMQTDARLVYRQAELARIEGDADRADSLAEKARQMDDQSGMGRVQTAMHLQLSGLGYWAERELDLIAGCDECESSVRIQASGILAEIRYTNREFELARQGLDKAIRLSADNGDAKVVIPAGPRLESRYHYFAYLAAVQSGDDELARLHLLDGLEIAPNESDLLIAATRYFRRSQTQEGSAAGQSQWSLVTDELVDLALQERSERIQSLRVSHARDARQSRLQTQELIDQLNSYAWLASQTGKSLETAEQYARQAVELSPGSSHLMDTLAACLFSQSRIEEAIAFQQKAVRASPWSRPLQNELMRYRSARMLSQMPTLYR